MQCWHIHKWQEVLWEKKWERCRASNNPCWYSNNWHFLGFSSILPVDFFWPIYICHGGRYMKKRVLKKRMIKRKLRRHLDSAASRGPPWKASLQGKSLTVILAPTLSGISGYHLHLILFLLSWENIIQPVKRLAINCCWIIFQQMLRNQSSRSLNHLPDLILHHM